MRYDRLTNTGTIGSTLLQSINHVQVRRDALVGIHVTFQVARKLRRRIGKQRMILAACAVRLPSRSSRSYEAPRLTNKDLPSGVQCTGTSPGWVFGDGHKHHVLNCAVEIHQPYSDAARLEALSKHKTC